MPVSELTMPWEDGSHPCVLAPPHLEVWASRAATFLARSGMGGVIAFATSGSSGSPPRAIVFTRQALAICARGALDHLHADRGDWCCPLPIWHVGGAMIYMRAALAGTKVYRLPGKWNPHDYAELMQNSGARWSSLVPTQVIDLVNCGLTAPDTARCIIVGGGELNRQTGEQARALGWPVVQSYGMTEAGSQLATALPHDPYHTDRLDILPHWEAAEGEGGRAMFQGPGKLCGRLLTKDDEGGFSYEPVPPETWWMTQDIVRKEGRLLTFLRRADRQVKILGELVDPEAVQNGLRHHEPHAVIEAIPHPRTGMELVACGSSAARLAKACRLWNAQAPGPQRIHLVHETAIPLTEMGKINRKLLQDMLCRETSKRLHLEQI